MGIFDFFRRKKKLKDTSDFTIYENIKSNYRKQRISTTPTLTKGPILKIKKPVCKTKPIRKPFAPIGNKKKRATIDGHRNPSLYDDDFDGFDLATNDSDHYVKPVSNTPGETPVINGYTPREDAIKPTPVESNTETSSYDSSSNFNSDSGSSSSDYSTSDNDF